jgi:hypothetical protein
MITETRHSPTYYVPAGPDEEMLAEVDRIAEVLGTTPEWRNGY